MGDGNDWFKINDAVPFTTTFFKELASAFAATVVFKTIDTNCSDHNDLRQPFYTRS